MRAAAAVITLAAIAVARVRFDELTPDEAGEIMSASARRTMID